MSDAEVQSHWSGLEKRHAEEKAEAVMLYLQERSMGDLAKLLKFSTRWVKNTIDLAGAVAAMGGVTAATPLSAPGGGGSVRDQLKAVIKKYAPDTESKEFESYVEHYSRQGHTPEVANRLARAEWAVEEAVDRGVIQESHNKKNERVKRIVMPDDADGFTLNLKHHMARVKMAAKFLDGAKVDRLRRKSSCEKVAEADEAWAEQMERMRNFHPTFDEVL